MLGNRLSSVLEFQKLPIGVACFVAFVLRACCECVFFYLVLNS